MATEIAGRVVPADLDVWVLAGQSNMEGCGWLEGALPSDDRVWSFSSAGQWEIAADPLHYLWESFTPVHALLRQGSMSADERRVSVAERARVERAGRTTGAGLGIAFGSAMADAGGGPIGLIPAAHGGTSLEQWSQHHRALGGAGLYGAMLERIARAGGRLRGILWYQGESDTTTMQAADSYAERLDAWIAAVRADTGCADLPVIVVQIGRVIEPAAAPTQWPGWDRVRVALAELPHRVAHTAVTTAVDLPLCDIIHISSAGLIRLGRRLARLALALMAGTVAPAGRSTRPVDVATAGTGRPTPATDATDAADGPALRSVVRHRLPTGGYNALRLGFANVCDGWATQGSLHGFTVLEPATSAAQSTPASAGQPAPAPVPELLIVDAWVDPQDRTAVVILCNREPGADVHVGYGIGLNPHCNLVDATDTPLCAFAPQPLTQR